MRGVTSCAAALLLLGFAAGVSAQRRADGEFDLKQAEAFLDLKQVESLHLDDVHPGVGNKRVVDLYFRALTRFSVPVRGIRPGDIEVWEDDERIDKDDVDIAPLEATGRGVSAVLAIDASGTMKGEPFSRAKDAALAFLERLLPEDRIAIVSFAEDVRVVVGFDALRNETRQALRNLEINFERSQHTLLYDGVYRAVDLIRRSPSLPRRAFVIVFSDGNDGGSDRSREQVIRACEGGGDEPHVLIFSIGYARFGGGGLKEMERLAEPTGGAFLEAASMVYLRDFFDSIATQMMGSYLLSFPSAMDGEEHELRITLKQLTASRKSRYPEISGPIWPWVLALAALGLVAGILLLVGAGTSQGRLSIVSGPNAGAVIALKPGKNRIGALEDNDISLPSNTVSRYHAEIVSRGRRVQILDLDSRNGTRVNGQTVRESPLQPGDRIEIADVELVYQR